MSVMMVLSCLHLGQKGSDIATYERTRKERNTLEKRDIRRNKGESGLEGAPSESGVESEALSTSKTIETEGSRRHQV